MPRDIKSLFAEQISSIASCCSHNSRKPISIQAGRRTVRASYAALMIVMIACIALNGCGAGGYAGGGITNLSSSAITIDAGQAFQLDAAVSGNALVSWSMATSCSANACGELSSATGLSITYTAPAAITSQMKLTVTAAIDGTASSKVVNITVNPDPVISGTPPSGTVGTPYTTTLKASGGTAPLTFTTIGSLPAGLSFNAGTGVISGTPTTAGAFSFSAQIVDSSDVPFTVKTAESIAISTPVAPLTFIAGNPPAGTVGVPYSTSLSASGGTAPYDFSLIAGTLPAGLEISAATGAITGTPTAAGTSSFTAQVADASGTKASAGFSILINPVSSGQTLALSLLPGATVGVPYNATIGVTGGTSPYTCLETAGALPAGLTLSTSCVVSGTPTVAGTSTLTVKATDSSSPALTITGPETIVVSSVGGLALSSPPNATVGTPYSGNIGVAGGTAPYSCVIVSGSLPPGLALGSACLITGTPTIAGTWDLTVTATDSSSPMKTITGPISLTVLPSALTLTLSTLPGATVGVPYTATIGVSGGTAPYSCLQTGGTLPAGLTLSASCIVSGTPTTAGTSTVTVKATDSSSPAETVTGPESITVAPAPVLVLSNPPGATVNVPYTGTIGVTGGTSPYACVLVTGPLPAGLTLGANCVVTGTPTTAGTYPITVKATDTSTPVRTTTSVVTVVVSPAPLTLTLSTLPGATVGIPYTATIGVSGGTAPYTCLQTGGTLPPGLTLSAACVVSGTPTTAGTSTVTVKATDSSSPAETVTGPESITVAPVPVLVLSNPPGATANTPYTGTIGVTGGTAPYTCVLLTGPLPAGLTLGANCVITGTPTTPGTYPITVKATDTSTPVRTGTSIVTVTVSPAPLTLNLSTLPGATVGIPYTATIGVSGGIAPYTCIQAGGTLPPGLTLSASCVVSGTPTTAGPYTVQVMATDSSNPAETVTGPESITVSASSPLVLSNPPGATVNTPYTGTIGVTGGTAPYTCVLITGPLPAGLTLGTNCVITGTPTATGTFPITVKATDSGTPAKTITGTVTVTVSPTPLTITVSNLPNGTVGTPYSATIGVSGGTAPYSCTITAGTLPAGLSLGAGCVVSGTPTVADSVILSVKATDSSNPVETTTGPVGLTILPAIPTLTLSNPPPATVNLPYTGTIGVSGGKAPYSCAITAGTLPAGLTLGAGCVISGTPTTATPPTTVVTVKATDSSNPVATTTGPVTVTVLPATATLTLSNPPAATVSIPYTGTIGVSGGTAPYSCSLVAGTLPAGLTLGAACVVSGTPTTAGTVNVTIHATDSATPTADQVTGPVTFTVNPVPPLSLTGSLPNAILGVPYTQTLVATGGVPPYTYALTAGSLPPGLNLSSTGTISGTPTAVGASSFTVTATDHESTPQTASLPLVLLVVYPTTPTDSELTGPYAFLFQGYDDVVAGVLAYQTATVASFTADNRGLMTITTLNADGTTGATSTYAITVKAPVPPATVATQASLIEFDDDQLVGTRGSGTMLAQQPTAFSAGLQGSYAFGMSGDTPCLPSCTLGIVAGPAASVGEFTTDGSSLLTGGTSDANIASTNYAAAPLTGSYSAADGNGRLALTMDTAGTPVGIYPTDYAVYLVSANQAFVMSTDKHSAYLLLAGTAQLKTQTTFSNASMDSAIVGYENAQSNPGLLGVLLQNVLNLSSATIFRATGNGAGHCDFTNVDVAGLTGLVNGLTGLGFGNTILNALLGTYQSTGTSVCTVASSGRGVLNYPNPDTLLTLLLETLGLSTGPPPPREFYLVSPNNGYFLETGYAGLGRFEAQTGTPSTLASLDGTYVYASLPAASLASINSSGILVANGTGSATSTLDLNVGVGTINVLEVGVTSTSAYTLSNAADGRFVLGATTVIYEIAPGRFVLVDTSALTTSPGISLLY